MESMYNGFNCDWITFINGIPTFHCGSCMCDISIRENRLYMPYDKNCSGYKVWVLEADYSYLLIDKKDFYRQFQVIDIDVNTCVVQYLKIDDKRELEKVKEIFKEEDVI